MFEPIEMWGRLKISFKNIQIYEKKLTIEDIFLLVFKEWINVKVFNSRLLTLDELGGPIEQQKEQVPCKIQSDIYKRMVLVIEIQVNIYSIDVIITKK